MFVLRKRKKKKKTAMKTFFFLFFFFFLKFTKKKKKKKKKIALCSFLASHAYSSAVLFVRPTHHSAMNYRI